MTSVKKAFDSGAIPASQSEHLSYAEKFFGIQRCSLCEAGVAPESRPFFQAIYGYQPKTDRHDRKEAPNAEL